MNDPLAQLEPSQPVIEDLVRDLLIEMKGFKYQITLKLLSSKQKKIEIQNTQLSILILQQKEWLILINMALINLSNKFYIE